MKKKRVLKESDEKIIIMRNKSIKRKKQRRITFVAFLLVIAAILALLLTPIFNIKYIDVSGHNKVSQKTIVETSGISYGENIFKLNIKKMKVKLNKLPYIEDVKIIRKIPDVVVFEIIERKPIVAVAVGDSFAYMDENGRFLEIVKQNNLPVLEGVKTKIELGTFLGDAYPALYENFKSKYALLKENGLGERVSHYKTDAKENVSFVIDGTKTIVLGEETNSEYKFKMLEKVIAELPPTQKGIIDLSVEGKALFTPTE